MNEIERLLRQQAGHPLPDVAAAAAAAALLDVAYVIEDSPVGPLLLASTPTGLVRVAYVGEHDEQPLLA